MVLSHKVRLGPLKMLHFAITGRWVSHLSVEIEIFHTDDVTFADVCEASSAAIDNQLLLNAKNASRRMNF